MGAVSMRTRSAGLRVAPACGHWTWLGGYLATAHSSVGALSRCRGSTGDGRRSPGIGISSNDSRLTMFRMGKNGVIWGTA